MKRPREGKTSSSHPGKEKHPGKFLFSHEHNKLLRAVTKTGVKMKLLSKHIRIVNWNRFPFRHTHTHTHFGCDCCLAATRKQNDLGQKPSKREKLLMWKRNWNWLNVWRTRRKFNLIALTCTHTVRVYRMNGDWVRGINNWKCSLRSEMVLCRRLEILI